jgi:L-asparagine transporter-like permease
MKIHRFSEYVITFNKSLKNIVFHNPNKWSFSKFSGEFVGYMLGELNEWNLFSVGFISLNLSNSFYLV